MKAWILTASYLWKDIWSRWLETPGALLARLLVAFLLTGLMLLGQASLLLAEHSIETRVARLGAQTLVVSEAVSGGAARPGLGRLLPAAPAAELLALRQASVHAWDEFGHTLRVLVYGPESLPALAPLLATSPLAAVHTLNPGMPAGIHVRVTIDGRDYPGANLTPPDSLQRLATGQIIVLVPESIGESWLATGWFETALLFCHDGNLPRLASAVRALLQLEDRTQAQLQSPEALLDELRDLRRIQHRAQAGAGLGGGIVVALLFGSIAILEYRQNRYVAALLRSCGAPPPLLVARYGVEVLLVTGAAVLAARLLLTGLHLPLFTRAGIESALLDRSRLDPYAWSLIWQQARWLLLGGLLSLLPIAFSLRQPVGRILQ